VIQKAAEIVGTVALFAAGACLAVAAFAASWGVMMVAIRWGFGG
jgi:hypothetical protein